MLLLKSSKNLRDSPQTSRKPFSRAISLETAQFYGTQTKTCFFCNIAERSLVKLTRKKTRCSKKDSSNWEKQAKRFFEGNQIQIKVTR